MHRWSVRHTTATATALAVCGALALTGCSSVEEVAFGRTANVEAEKGYSVDVTVLGLEAGTSADLDQLKDASKYEGRTPYYLRYRFTKTDDGAAADWSADFEVRDGEGSLTQLSVLPSIDATGDLDDPFDVNTFDKCQGSTGFDKLPKGASVEGCEIYLTDSGGGAPESVNWVLGDETLVTWK